VTATAAGQGRLFDLDNLKAPQVTLGDVDMKAIHAVAFNADGSLCVAGDEEGYLCVWETTKGKLASNIVRAHRQAITSVVFTSKGQVVSAGGDKRLIVWDLTGTGAAGRKLEKVSSFDHRSGDVARLDVDPAGEHVLFDDDRDLRILSLQTNKIAGVLPAPSRPATFKTLALYSPDGKTILTGSNGTARLQLWRAPSAKMRATPLRTFAWSKGAITSGAFAPAGTFAVTGTRDAQVLVWMMPSKDEREKPLAAQLDSVDSFLDSKQRITVRATLDNPGWIIPGGTATLVVPARSR
jgi:WD40 repeat protein